MIKYYFLAIPAFFKQLMLAFSLVVGQFVFTTPLTAQNYTVDNTEPYELVVPNLDVLHTNMVFSREDQLQKTFFDVDKDSTCTIIGDLITADTLIKYIKTADILTKSDIAKTDKLYLDDNKPKIKNLKIYCDSFNLNQPLWFPGVNVLIHARSIYWARENDILKTDPRPWREDKAASKAQNGADAGNIEIITKFLYAYNARLSACGGNGMNVQFGNITFTPYPTMQYVWAEDCGVSFASNKNNCSNEKDLGSGVVGLLHWSKMQSDCSGQYKFLSNAEGNYQPNSTDSYTGLYYDNGKFYDGAASTRLSWAGCKDRKIGKGGKEGSISLISEEPYNPISGANRPGFDGGYYAPNKTISEVEVGYNTNSDGIITGGIKLNSGKTYTVWFAEVERAGMKGTPPCWYYYSLKYEKSFSFYSLELKTKNGASARLDFYNAYQDYSYLSPSRSYTDKPVTRNKFTPSELYLRHKLILEKNKIKDYQSLSPKDAAEVLVNLNAIAKNIDLSVIGHSEALEKAKSSNDKDAINFHSFKLAEAQKLGGELALASKSVNTKQYVDEFNNPLGYRPVLSFTAINQFMQNNIDTDLSLYINAADAMKNINDRTVFIKKIPELKASLETAINKAYGDLKENEAGIDKLGDEGLDLAKGAIFLNDSLVKLEKRLKDQAKGEAEKEKIVRTVSKVLAVGAACGATALGGPAAGAMTYGLVDKLSAGAIDNQYGNGESGAKAVQSGINIAPFLEKLKEKKLEPVQNAMANLEYRKSALFNKIDQWDTKDKTFLTAPFPASLKDYKRMKSLNEEVTKEIKSNYENKTAYASFAVKGGEEIYSTIVNTNILDKAIDRVVNKSVEYKEMGQAIKYNAVKYGDFATKLRSKILEKGDITDKIWEFNRQKHQLNVILINPEAYMDPLLANSMATMQTESLKRLKWMEYQLMKVYNYTTLQPYPADSIANYRLLFSKELENTDVKERLTTMRTAYEGYLQTIKSAIVRNASTKPQQDKTGVDMFISGDSKMLQAINEEKIYSIDLYNDFNDAVIEPNKNNIRILSFDLNEFEFSRPLKDGEKLNLTVEFDDEGVLRKDDKFYLFKDDSSSMTKWEWSFSPPARGSNEQATFSVNENSDYNNKMLDFILGKDGKKSSIDYKFTLKTAWSKMKMYATATSMSSSDPVKIKSLRFKVRRDYEFAKNDQKVCDLRVNADDTDVRLVVKKGQNKPDTISHSEYNVFTKDETVALTAYSIDTARVFSHWEAVPDTLRKMANGNALTFTVDIKRGRDVRVKPVFLNKPSKGLLSSGVPASAPTDAPAPAFDPKRTINLYEAPELTSEAALSVPYSYLIRNLKLDRTETNGFKRVVYGFEEYFVKKKDLE